MEGETIETLVPGISLSISVSPTGAITVGLPNSQTTVINPDIQAQNGILHEVFPMMIPPESAPAPAPTPMPAPAPVVISPSPPPPLGKLWKTAYQIILT